MIVSLEDVPKHSEVDVGLKAWNLSKVKRSGANVPFTAVMPSEEISDLISYSGIRHKIFRLSRALIEAEDPEEIWKLDKDLRLSILSLEIPDDLLDEIMDFIAGNIEKIMVARPSPYAPGLVDGDLKGRMSVWYDEPTKRGLREALRHILSSAFSLRSVARLLDLGIYPEDLSLAVILQSVVLPRSSGIAVCCPARRRNEILVESTWGAMDSVPKDRFRISIDLMEIVESELSEKKIKLIPTLQGLKEVDVPHHLWMEPSLKVNEVKNITKVSSDLSLILGTPTLVEWIVQDGTDSLFVIQAHKEPERPPIKALEKKVMKWLDERRSQKEMPKEVEIRPKEVRRFSEAREMAPMKYHVFIASKIFVRSSSREISGVDGYLMDVEDLEGIIPDEGKVYLVFVPPDLESIKLPDLGPETKLVVRVSNLEVAKESVKLSSLFPFSDFIAYISDTTSVLLSESLSEIFEGAVLDIGSLRKLGEEVLRASVSVATKHFNYVLADISGANLSVDIVEELLEEGVDGFCVDEESLDDQLVVIGRAEMRYLLRKVRDIELMLGFREELEG
ncbi:MAG TPA: hypothetical protein ENF57_03000 [Candidatus Korarchaeota archaeon]|nr:hypothetical protein [Candidatus Korarchaeota archaeon]